MLLKLKPERYSCKAVQLSSSLASNRVRTRAIEGKRQDFEKNKNKALNLWSLAMYHGACKKYIRPMSPFEDK
jgi:hypothetical protein